MQTTPELQHAPGRSRGWPRAAILFGITLATSVVQPSVLIGVPFLALGIAMGMRKIGMFVAMALVVAMLLRGGEQDALWFMERGWALLAGGGFVALSMKRPDSSFSGRAMAAVAAAAVVAAILLGINAGSWATLDAVMKDRMGQGVATAIEALQIFRGGDALPPAVITAVYQTVEVQLKVFPALLGIASMAALGVAWWGYVRLSSGSDQGVGPLRYYRFNDHLVWVFILGLLMVLPRWGDLVTRVGANAVVFMGALYAVRGAAVILFLSGGFSLLGYLLLAFGVVFVPPLVLVGALVIGLGDTWLDVRSKVGPRAA